MKKAEAVEKVMELSTVKAAITRHEARRPDAPAAARDLDIPPAPTSVQPGRPSTGSVGSCDGRVAVVVAVAGSGEPSDAGLVDPARVAEVPNSGTGVNF